MSHLSGHMLDFTRVRSQELGTSRPEPASSFSAGVLLSSLCGLLFSVHVVHVATPIRHTAGSRTLPLGVPVPRSQRAKVDGSRMDHMVLLDPISCGQGGRLLVYHSAPGSHSWVFNQEQRKLTPTLDLYGNVGQSR